MEYDITTGQLQIGQLVAERYVVEELIGRGGMAEVYRARDERLARPVALKVLRGHYARDPGLRTRFEEEAKAAAMVSHPNVIGVYDAGEDGGQAFIVMELVTGETLSDRIERGPLELENARQVGVDVLDALAAAHARGVLHRDIKPANVLLTDEGDAKVADFGIAKAIHPSPDGSEPTTMNVVFGTPSYLAPERAQGHPATARSDLWSVGVLLYEALTGAKPFEGDTPLAVTFAAQEGRHEPLLRRRPDTDPVVAVVVERALSADPADRYASAEEMAADLRTTGETGTTAPMALVPAVGLAATAGLAATRAFGDVTGVLVAGTDRVRPRNSRRLLLLAGVAAVLLAAGLFGPALLGSDHPARAGHAPKPTAPSTTLPKLTASTPSSTPTSTPSTTPSTAPPATSPSTTTTQPAPTTTQPPQTTTTLPVTTTTTTLPVTTTTAPGASRPSQSPPS